MLGVEPNEGLEFNDPKFKTWSEIKGQNFNWLSYPGTPPYVFWLEHLVICIQTNFW